MAEIQERTVIAAPPAEVFDYRLDFAAHLRGYNPSVRQVVQTHGEGPGPGSAYRVRVRLVPGWTTDATLTVTDAVRPSRVADLAESMVSAHEIVSFEPRVLADGRAGTEVSFSVQTKPAGLLWRLLDVFVLPWVTRRQVRTELRRMRQDLESRARR